MSPSLVDLKIATTEVDRLCGLEVGDLFVGGMIGGGYRLNLWQDPKRLGLFCVTQVLGAGLLLMLSLPLGLLASRAVPTANARDAINPAPFLATVLTTTGVGLLGWHGLLGWRSRRLHKLNQLLDEVDRYHEVLEVLNLYDQFQALQPLQALPPVLDSPSPIPQIPALSARSEILAALQLTRDSLITALQAERLLRQNRRLLSQRRDLSDRLAQNLSALTALEIQEQTQESAEVLAEVLEIGRALRSVLPS